MFENIDWTGSDVGYDLKDELVVAVQKLASGRAVIVPAVWLRTLQKGVDGKTPARFWRTVSQSIQFDVHQLLVDEVGRQELNRQLKKIVGQLIESTKAVLESHPDVYCHPTMHIEQKAFLISFFWYVEYVQVA